MIKKRSSNTSLFFYLNLLEHIMKAFKLIDATRAYLDHLENHIAYVNLSFDLVKEACESVFDWDEEFWIKLREEVDLHDLSKLSCLELTQYRDFFNPVEGQDSEQVKQHFYNAWKSHIENNSHHYQSLKTDRDVVHMIIDWTAMGMQKGNDCKRFYLSRKDQIESHLSEKHREMAFIILDALEPTEPQWAKQVS